MEPINLEGRDFLASYQQYKDFFVSALWIDLQQEINSWIDDIHGCLGNENDIQEIYRFQGRLQACHQLLDLPARILSAMEVAHEIIEDQVTLDLGRSNSVPDEYYQEQLKKWGEEDVESV